LLANIYAALRFAVGCRGDFRHPGSSVSAAEQPQLSPSPALAINGMDVVASSTSLGTPVTASPPTYRRATYGRDVDP